MTAIDPLPAIRRIDTDRDDLCALEVAGHFTSNDLENAYGLLEGAYAMHDKVDLLVRIKDYDGFDWGAVFDESTIRGKAQALRHIRNYAVVGGPGWMRAVLAVFGPLTSIRTRHFDIAEESKAWEWIGGKEKPLKT
ncbi:STAS/SEC14 domain-containing protein [Mesorhizobium sp. ZC-5]|uniref:STAS/SEC14 domain-containing protein n=1 Tax=Mesorhizobium sp. ZC-5 TaxID=2986066 RepID=UPI0021E795C9|nr:STAS/SEC14 domain-containing protein [Mesorhizobium sp. ZC-5]MCV3240988.1 STAS/SEC14 domain-containing protein [Mesorhizobium sp. ZC-5]